jgi:hypothetical protein
MARDCGCGMNDRHSLNGGGKYDGIRKYGATYKPPKTKKEKKAAKAVGESRQ